MVEKGNTFCVEFFCAAYCCCWCFDYVLLLMLLLLLHEYASHYDYYYGVRIL